MKICERYKDKLIDYFEDELSREERVKFTEHLKQCDLCQAEYARVKKLYTIFDKDKVVIPPQEFFDDLKIRGRQREYEPRKTFTKRFLKIFKILVPACAVAAAVLLLLKKPEKTIEITVPLSVLLEDREIARMSLNGIVDDELLEGLSEVEDNLYFEIDETIDELTDEEKAELIDNLRRKYGINI